MSEILLEHEENQTFSAKTRIKEATAIIDRALREMSQRELASTAEVSDLLLDMRSILSAGDSLADAYIVPVTNS